LREMDAGKDASVILQSLGKHHTTFAEQVHHECEETRGAFERAGDAVSLAAHEIAEHFWHRKSSMDNAEQADNDMPLSSHINPGLVKLH
ncbi:hypothetical protein PENTCL1PPCAC_9852, partial [Pristionchus entomophagus]